MDKQTFNMLSAFKLDKGFLVLFLSAAIIFLSASAYYYHKTIQDDGSISLVDFRVYYYAGFRLEAKEKIYDTRDGEFIYKYSPIFALIMSVVRFYTSTPAGALRLWYLVLFISFLFSLYVVKEILFFPEARRRRFGFFDAIPLLFIIRYLIVINFTRSYQPTEWPLFVRAYDKFLCVVPLFYIPGLVLTKKDRHETRYFLVLALAILILMRFILLNIDRAQVNMLILALVLLFAYYLKNGKDIMSGLYLGAAMILKLSPAIFLGYLVAKKKIKSFLSSIIAFTLFLFLPSFKWGFKNNMDLIKGWLDMLKVTYNMEYLQYKNQSLMAMISRLFSANSDIAIIRLSDGWVMGVVAIFYALFISLLIYYLAKDGRSGNEEDMAIDLSLFFVSMTILFPVGTKATFIFLLLPISVIIKEVFKRDFKARVINAGLLIYASLVYLNSHDIIGDFALLLHKYSLMTFSILLLFFMLAYIKHALPREGAGV